MRKLLYSVAALSAALAVNSRAGLLVEQWQTPDGVFGGIGGLEAEIALGAADIAETWDIIDFTDDPGGFAGDIAGSDPWPAATAAGAFSPADPVNNFFGARISGTILITTADTYHFKTYSDDGVRLKIGGTTVILDDSYHPETINLGSIALAPGSYPLELLFFEGGGEASLEFQVAKGTGPYGHVGGLGGPSVSTPDAGATLPLLGFGFSGLAWFVAQSRKARKG